MKSNKEAMDAGEGDSMLLQQVGGGGDAAGLEDSQRKGLEAATGPRRRWSGR